MLEQPAVSAVSDEMRFPIQDVNPSPDRRKALSAAEAEKAWARFGHVEATSPFPPNVCHVFTQHNMLAKAVYSAFYDHHPLRLSPDAVWLTVVQGFALHINQSPEEHRSKFVFHQGKEKIVIFAPDVEKEGKLSNWPGVFPAFVAGIRARTKVELFSLVECNFSTTSETDLIVSQIGLMDAMQSYFEYELVCGCGIPYIELLGTPKDWETIRQRAASLTSYGMDWWAAELLPVLDEFVDASRGSPNLKFWQSICNLYGASGIRQPITGWIQVFFPYLLANDNRHDTPRIGPEVQRNPYLGQWRLSVEHDTTGDLEQGFQAGKMCGRGVDIENIPGGMSKVPFKMTDVRNPNKSNDMLFLGGLSAICQDPVDGCLMPVSGWAIVEDCAPAPAQAGGRGYIGRKLCKVFTRPDRNPLLKQ